MAAPGANAAPCSTSLTGDKRQLCYRCGALIDAEYVLSQSERRSPPTPPRHHSLSHDVRPIDVTGPRRDVSASDVGEQTMTSTPTDETPSRHRHRRHRRSAADPLPRAPTPRSSPSTGHDPPREVPPARTTCVDQTPDDATSRDADSAPPETFANLVKSFEGCRYRLPTNVRIHDIYSIGCEQFNNIRRKYN